MRVSDRQPTEVREILETQDREELRRAAHTIAWARNERQHQRSEPVCGSRPQPLHARGRATRRQALA
jgi:hypothetical protein